MDACVNQMIEILVLRILSFSGLMVSFEFDGWSIYNRIGLETNNESKRIACWMVYVLKWIGLLVKLFAIFWFCFIKIVGMVTQFMENGRV